MKKYTVARFTGLLAIMFILLACGMFTRPTPTTLPPTEIPATEIPTQVKATEVPPTLAPTEIPPTQVPVTAIRIGPGKFGKPIWLEVMEGEYKLTSGDTLLPGSAIGVTDDMLTFEPELSIEVADGGAILKGIDYAAGTLLVVDASGNIIEVGKSASDNPPAATGNYLFQDDFSSNNKGWETGEENSEYGDIDRQIANGQYVITMEGKQEYHFAINSIPDVKANNFRFSIDSTILESDVTAGNLSIEVSFREVDGVDGKHYSISLYDDGTYSADVWPTGDWQSIVDLWERQDSNDIKLDTGIKNTIVIEANGPVVTLFVNGKQIDTFTDSTINEKGDLSLNLGLDQPDEHLKIAFDNLTIQEIK
jgi:hypothetical protein